MCTPNCTSVPFADRFEGGSWRVGKVAAIVLSVPYDLATSTLASTGFAADEIDSNPQLADRLVFAQNLQFCCGAVRYIDVANGNAVVRGAFNAVGCRGAALTTDESRVYATCRDGTYELFAPGMNSTGPP